VRNFVILSIFRQYGRANGQIAGFLPDGFLPGFEGLVPYCGADSGSI
jgi:hypothetical protein